MKPFFIGRRLAIPSATVPAFVVATGLALGCFTVPAEADVLRLRKGVAVGENGTAARAGGYVSNGEGEWAVRRGGFAADAQGNGGARRGGCVDGQTANGCRGRAASWNSDGSLSGQAGAEFSGENGAVSSRRALQRDTDGTLSGNRSTDASGDNGSYAAASSFENGSYNRDGTYTGTEGKSANVEGNWALGTGGSRALTCVDASGAIVDCH